MALEIPSSPDPNIDVPRLFMDFALSRSDLRAVATLDIPPLIAIPSVSPIKIGTVSDVLGIVRAGETFEVIGVQAPSDVAEQPLGQMAINGALNRICNGIATRGKDKSRAAWFSIENGLFRVQRQDAPPSPNAPQLAGLLRFTEDADLTATFDPDADYEDRAVAAIHLPHSPGRRLIVQVSPSSEAVRFPRGAVKAAYDAEGSLEQNTAGSKLAEMGLVKDKQNPHADLTTDRAEGVLTRQEQMARALIRALVRLARER